MVQYFFAGIFLRVAFILCHVAHNIQYCFTVLLVLGHQKVFERFANVLSILG